MDHVFSSDRHTQASDSSRELAESIEEYCYRIQKLLARRETWFRQRFLIEEESCGGGPVG